MSTTAKSKQKKSESPAPTTHLCNFKVDHSIHEKFKRFSKHNNRTVTQQLIELMEKSMEGFN